MQPCLPVINSVTETEVPITVSITHSISNPDMIGNCDVIDIHSLPQACG